MAWVNRASASNPQPASGAENVPINPTTQTQTNQVNFNPNDQSSPYFLHSNESPALDLISKHLEGSNYLPWARGKKMALLSKNTLGFVDGSIMMPAQNDPRFQCWEQCNNMVLSWIIRAVTPTIGRSVLWIDSA